MGCSQLHPGVGATLERREDRQGAILLWELSVKTAFLVEPDSYRGLGSTKDTTYHEGHEEFCTALCPLCFLSVLRGPATNGSALVHNRACGELPPSWRLCVKPLLCDKHLSMSSPDLIR